MNKSNIEKIRDANHQTHEEMEDISREAIQLKNAASKSAKDGVKAII